MPTKTAQLDPVTHSRCVEIKRETGKSMTRILSDGVEALEALRNLVAAVQSDRPKMLNKAMAQAKAML